MVFLFFIKQKTAYEMRMSDWSSDVCSSDLPDGETNQVLAGNIAGKNPRAIGWRRGHPDHDARQAAYPNHDTEPEDGEEDRRPDGGHRQRRRKDNSTDWKCDELGDRKSTRLNSSHYCDARMPSSA